MLYFFSGKVLLFGQMLFYHSRFRYLLGAIIFGQMLFVPIKFHFFLASFHDPNSTCSITIAYGSSIIEDDRYIKERINI